MKTVETVKKDAFKYLLFVGFIDFDLCSRLTSYHQLVLESKSDYLWTDLLHYRCAVLWPPFLCKSEVMNMKLRLSDRVCPKSSNVSQISVEN